MWENTFHQRACRSLGKFPVMAKATRMPTANIRTQFFFGITTTASTLFLVENFQLKSVSNVLSPRL